MKNNTWLYLHIIMLALVLSSSLSNADDKSIDSGNREKSLPFAEFFQDSIDHSRLDVQHFAQSLPHEPHTITKYFQQSFSLDPYVGSLRGARGVLAARAGNSIDKSQLLAEVLFRKGYKIRFAYARLSREQAEKILRKQFSTVPKYVKSPPLLKELLTTAEIHLTEIANALHREGFQTPSTFAQSWEQVVKNIKDHYWIQVLVNGKWIDMDVTPGVEFGNAIAKATQVMKRLPTSLDYSISFHVELDTIKNGKVYGERILSYTSTSAELTSVPIGLYHAEKDHGIRAYLVIDAETLESAEIEPSKLIPRNNIDAASDLGSVVSNVFISLGGVTAKSEDKPEEPLVVGERLIVEIDGPTGKSISIHPVWNANVGNEDTKREMIVNAGRWNTILGFSVSTGGEWQDALLASTLSEIEYPFEQRDIIRLLHINNLLFEGLRSSIRASRFIEKARRYIDGPNVLITGIKRCRASDEIEVDMNLAIKNYGIIYAESPDISPYALFYDYIANGVVDLMLEQLLLESIVKYHTGAPLFEASLGEPSPLNVVETKKQLARAGIPTKCRDLVESALRKKRIVLAPSDPPSNEGVERYNWWEIDPRTGWTEDTNESGKHGTAEDAILRKKVSIETTKTVKDYACTLFAVATIAAASTGIQIAGLWEAVGISVSEAAGVKTYGEALKELVNNLCGKKSSTRPPPPRRGVIGRAWRKPGSSGFKPNPRYGNDLPRGGWTDKGLRPRRHR